MMRRPDGPNQGRLFPAEETSSAYAEYKLAKHAALGDQFQGVFDVDYTESKDTLKAGELHTGTSRVNVMGTSESDARLAAEQMVAARGKEPTGVRRVH